MPTPDASQFTQFKRYSSVSADACASRGTKISPFNTSYSIPVIGVCSQQTFLPSANKEFKFSPPVILPTDLPPIPVWVREIGNSDTTVYGVTISPIDGTVLVCGETTGTLFGGPFGSAFVARYTSAGVFIAGTTFGSIYSVIATSIATDTHGNIYVGGNTKESLSGPSTTYTDFVGFFLKLSPNFTLQWTSIIGSGYNTTQVTSITVSPDLYIYIGGYTYDPDWDNTSPHAGSEYRVGFVVYGDCTTGESLNTLFYGSGMTGDVSINSVFFIFAFSTQYLVCAGYSGEDLGNTDVSYPGDGGLYGFVAICPFDLVDIGFIVGAGSGRNNTVITSLSFISSVFGFSILVGGSTNEYINSTDVNKDSLLVGGGIQGFVGNLFMGFSDFILFGDERNTTVITSVSSSNNFSICFGGVTNENLNTNEKYTGESTVGFTYTFGILPGNDPLLVQIGSGSSSSNEQLYNISGDTFGNYYAVGDANEHLPRGPAIPNQIGYVAKVSDQPKTYNTPIFLTQDTNDGPLEVGVVFLEYTAPITIDWGDGTIDTITTGTEGVFFREYTSSGLYSITIDAGVGGEITLIRVNDAGVRTFDVSRCPTLLDIQCSNNFISNLNLSGCPNLTSLQCYGNELLSLDVSGLSQLTSLQFDQGGNNLISTIHYEGCGLIGGESVLPLDISIRELINANSNPGRIYLSSAQQTTYFGGDAATYFNTELPDWTFVIV